MAFSTLLRPSIRPPRRPGFTLIEMLVVITIVTLLLSLLLPVTTQARSLAVVTSCMSNLRQTGVRLNAYTNDYHNYPTNETPNVDWYYYRYYTRGGNGLYWLNQMDGTDGATYAFYRCTESLPADQNLTGSISTSGGNWTWAARTSPYGAEYVAGTTPNRMRNWYAYQGPLRPYPDVPPYTSSSATDPINNAWDLFGGGYSRGNASLSMFDPIGRASPANSQTKFDDGGPAKVVAYCPSLEKAPSGALWWNTWTSPHMTKPWSGDAVTTEPTHDSRNYLFTDGRVIFVNR